MHANARARGVRSAELLVVALALSAASALAQEAAQYTGQSLADALRALQAKGLRIVFTSAIVMPDMRVAAEPRAPTTRRQLDELLAPHGLRARDGPGGIIEVVRAEAPSRRRARPRSGVQRTAVGTIDATVVDTVTEAPVAGAALHLDDVQREARSDPGGRFILEGVHAGTRTLHVSALGYSDATRAVQVIAGATVAVTVRLSQTATTHHEYVTVTGPASSRNDHAVASETSLRRSELDGLYGSLADDPIRVVHAFPSVMPVDEFRSEFAVRGSSFRHVEFVVDGVSTHRLQHTAYDRGATGSVAMLPVFVLEDATLRAGAYPRRHGDRLGPQLDLTIREGSRRSFALRGAVGVANATLLGEGPLGAAARGSWLVALRQSYLEWPTERPESTRTAFGFFDGLAKVVYDVRSSQQVTASVLGGTANIDGEDNLAPNDLGDGTNRALAANLSWRSTFGPSFVVTQRAAVVVHQFVNRHQTGRESDRGANEQIVYRADITRPIAGSVLEGGAHIGRTAIDDVPRGAGAGALTASSLVRSGYAHFAWAATPTLTLSPGVRLSASTHLPRPAMTRWLLAEWIFRPRWTMTASVGVSQQLPDLRQVLGIAGALDPRPERARHLDVAIEQRLTSSIRWQATVFSREEHDILREPDLHPRIVNDVLVPPEGRYVHALAGSSRGVELLLERRSASGLSGWAAYSYGDMQHTDIERHETFWSDFDQRHALTLFGVYRFSARSSIGATLRRGSNFPIPGYLAARGGGLVVGPHRNRLRLPAYARLDVRADRTLEYFGRRLTLFGEVLNVLNRANVGLASGSVDAATGEAIGFTDTLFRRRALAGVLIHLR